MIAATLYQENTDRNVLQVKLGGLLTPTEFQIFYSLICPLYICSQNERDDVIKT
jgi:hypothetical protein